MEHYAGENYFFLSIDLLMKRYIILAIIIGVIGGPILAGAIGFYPIAIVDGSLIWFKTWNRSFQATGHALVVQARSGGTQLNLDPAVVAVIKKDTLAALIENQITARVGRKLFAKFDDESEKRVKDAMGVSKNIGEAAQLMYGLNVADFHDLILLPQSREELAQEILEKEHIHFAAWLSGIKKKAHVTIFVKGYSWDGERIRETLR